MELKKSLFALGVGVAALCAVAAANSAKAHECTTDAPECHELTETEKEAARLKALSEYRQKMAREQEERMRRERGAD